MACKEKCKHVNISGNLEGGCDHCDSFFKSILLIELRLKINFVFVFSPIIKKTWSDCSIQVWLWLDEKQKKNHYKQKFLWGYLISEVVVKMFFFKAIFYKCHSLHYEDSNFKFILHTLVYISIKHKSKIGKHVWKSLGKYHLIFSSSILKKIW